MSPLNWWGSYIPDAQVPTRLPAPHRIYSVEARISALATNPQAVLVPRRVYSVETGILHYDASSLPPHGVYVGTGPNLPTAPTGLVVVILASTE